MLTTWRDITHAMRLLRRTPGFTAVALLTLALGIGASTAVFTVVNALVLRPLPYPGADRLVMLWQDLRAQGGPVDEWASPGNFVDWNTALPAVERLAAIGGWRPTLTGDGGPDALAGEQVSHEYFSVLGRSPALGRDFTSTDDLPGARRVVLIGHGLWQRRFGADPSAIGRVITLGGEPHEVVGVLPEGLRPVVVADAQVWRPLRLNRAAPSRGAIVLRTIGRLADGVSVTQAQHAATALAVRLERELPEFNGKTGFLVQPLAERVIGGIRPALLALAGAVAVVLLIACANLAHLLMARASGRGRELATRLALGAGRGRVVRQLVTESLVLAVAGGALGLLVATWGVDGLVALAPADAPRLDEVRVDRAVFAMAVVLSLMTGVLVGLAPALQSSMTTMATAMHDGGRGSTGHGGRLLRRGLVTAEIALALVLLTGGVLLVETFTRLRSASLGFRTDSVIAGEVVPARTAYDTPEKLRALYDQLLERAASIPGVQQAALTSVLPLDGGDSDTSFRIPGRPAPASSGDTPVTWYRQVSASYFATMDIPIVRGRGFAANDATRSVIVNEAFVRRYFPTEEPLGRPLLFGDANQPPFTIVGVVADIRGRGAREAARVETYLPYWQLPEAGINIVLAGATPAALAGPLRAAVAAVDPNLPIIGVRTMDERLGLTIGQERFLATLAAGFAALAVTLAGIGIYGVMAYTVAQRTSEIGLRMALGAGSWQVFGLIVSDGLRLALLGTAAGLVGAALAGRALAAQLFGVSPTDTLRLAGAAAVIVGLAALASAVPAWRAMRVDPVEALRTD